MQNVWPLCTPYYASSHSEPNITRRAREVLDRHYIFTRAYCTFHAPLVIPVLLVFHDLPSSGGALVRRQQATSPLFWLSMNLGLNFQQAFRHRKHCFSWVHKSNCNLEQWCTPRCNKSSASDQITRSSTVRAFTSRSDYAGKQRRTYQRHLERYATAAASVRIGWLPTNGIRDVYLGCVVLVSLVMISLLKLGFFVSSFLGASVLCCPLLSCLLPTV